MANKGAIPRDSVPKKKVISKENEDIFFEDDDEYEFEPSSS